MPLSPLSGAHGHDRRKYLKRKEKKEGVREKERNEGRKEGKKQREKEKTERGRREQIITKLESKQGDW